MSIWGIIFEVISCVCGVFEDIKIVIGFVIFEIKVVLGFGII